MFYHIAGKFVHKEESFAVIDCGGVGYRLTISMNTADALGYADGERTVKLYTYLQVREDDLELFGFYTEEELAAFRLLITVSGVGPKAAMAILSLFTPTKLAMAVTAEDTKAISRANGIGPKTAARVVLELKDKFKGLPMQGATAETEAGAAAPRMPSDGKLGEALEALTVLGYGRTEVMEALRKLDAASLTVEQIITAALKYFATKG